MSATYLKGAGLTGLMILAAGCGGSPTTRVVPPPACTPASKPEFAYVLNGFGADSISMYTVDSCNGTLQPNTPATIATGGNQFGSESMVVSPSGKFVYVANLQSNAVDAANISMFSVDPASGLLTPTVPATVPTGFFPQGIAIDPSGRFLYTANSDDNSVSMFTADPNTGVLTPANPPSVAAGWSPDDLIVDPSGRFVYVSNQNDDTLSMYTINQSTGVLTPMTPATVATGLSPFQPTVDPTGKFLYVPNAYDFRNTVSQYTIDAVSGMLTPNTPSTATVGNQPVSVAVDPSSKFAYVANRFDGTISMFSINSKTGNLTPMGTVATGSDPQAVVVDPSGQYVYAAGSGVSIYTLPDTGILVPAGTVNNGGAPVRINLTKAQN